VFLGFSKISIIDLKPIISACSSEILNKSLQKKMDEAGFDHFYEVPIKSGIIKDQIIPNLIKRRDQLLLAKDDSNSLGVNIQEKLSRFNSFIK
jgi:hypothetical protein